MLFVFDLLFAGGEDLRPLPLLERKARLAELLAAAPAGPLRYVEHSEGPGPPLHESACRLGLEGIVSKKRDQPYRPGRGEGWLKAKCRAREEVVVGGWTTHGRGGRFRALLAGRPGEGGLAYVGSVETGFGHDVTLALLRRLKALETERTPFATGSPRKTGDVRWARPELVAEVDIASWTASGKIRQASFKGLREDKAAGEVVDG